MCARNLKRRIWGKIWIGPEWMSRNMFVSYRKTPVHIVVVVNHSVAPLGVPTPQHLDVDRFPRWTPI